MSWMHRGFWKLSAAGGNRTAVVVTSRRPLLMPCHGRGRSSTPLKQLTSNNDNDDNDETSCANYYQTNHHKAVMARSFSTLAATTMTLDNNHLFWKNSSSSHHHNGRRRQRRKDNENNNNIQRRTFHETPRNDMVLYGTIILVATLSYVAYKKYHGEPLKPKGASEAQATYQKLEQERQQRNQQHQERMKEVLKPKREDSPPK